MVYPCGRRVRAVHGFPPRGVGACRDPCPSRVAVLAFIPWTHRSPVLMGQPGEPVDVKAFFEAGWLLVPNVLASPPPPPPEAWPYPHNSYP